MYTLEPKMDVRGNPRPVKSTYDVDFAFGPDNRNEDVYSAVAGPLIEMALRGGVSTILAYGQTGSGKTRERPKPKFLLSANTEYSAPSKCRIFCRNRILCRIPNILLNT